MSSDANLGAKAGIFSRDLSPTGAEGFSSGRPDSELLDGQREGDRPWALLMTSGSHLLHANRSSGRKERSGGQRQVPSGLRPGRQGPAPLPSGKASHK